MKGDICVLPIANRVRLGDGGEHDHETNRHFTVCEGKQRWRVCTFGAVRTGAV